MPSAPRTLTSKRRCTTCSTPRPKAVSGATATWSGRNRHLPASGLPATADDVVPRFLPRRLDLAGVVGRRLRHLSVRRRARRFRDRKRIPGPRTVLAEPVQSDHGTGANGRPQSRGGMYLPKCPAVELRGMSLTPREKRRPRDEMKGYPGEPIG